MPDIALARQAMIDGQLRPNGVNETALISAFENVKREQFLPKNLRGIAYHDEDIQVAPGRFLIKPMVMARLMLALELQPSDLVLDIGCTNGYSTALFGHLAGAVVGVEDDPDLVEKANANLAATETDNAAVVEAALADGVPGQGPYDAIFLNGAVEQIPKALLAQLNDGGRLVCVQQEGAVGHARLLRRCGEEIAEQDLFDAMVATLPGFEKPQAFSF